jgi:hypothetical protein
LESVGRITGEVYSSGLFRATTSDGRIVPGAISMAPGVGTKLVNYFKRVYAADYPQFFRTVLREGAIPVKVSKHWRKFMYSMCAKHQAATGEACYPVTYMNYLFLFSGDITALVDVYPMPYAIETGGVGL